VYEVAIILLNYNATRDCVAMVHHIEQLRPFNHSRILTVVVDNNSAAEERSALSSSLQGKNDLCILYSLGNKGYSTGNNIGLHHARTRGIPYAIIANSDIEILTKSFADILVASNKMWQNQGLIGPKIFLPSGNEQCPITKPTILTSLGFAQRKSAQDGHVVYGTTGCFIFASLITWENLGWLDERIFLYREEWVLAERIRAAGLAWHLTYSVEIVHNHKRKTATLRTTVWHKYQEWRSTRFFFSNYLHKSRGYLIVYDLLLLTKTTIMVAMQILKVRTKQ
jgi:GT2 family glycosyltransferase